MMTLQEIVQPQSESWVAQDSDYILGSPVNVADFRGLGNSSLRAGLQEPGARRRIPVANRRSKLGMLYQNGDG